MDPTQNTAQTPQTPVASAPAEPPVVSNPAPTISEVKPVDFGTQNPEPLTGIVEPPPGGSKKSFKKLFLMLFLSLFFIFLAVAGVGAYAIAYEKIKLDKYPDIQKKVAEFVISLPFMPKTPKFLLAKSAYVHQNVTKESFDISMAIDSQDLASSLGLSALDVLAKGSVDYSDPKNVKLSLNTSITKDFNLELIKADKFLYFKINKVPQILLTTLGLKSNDLDPLLNKWVSYDTTPLDTEARRSMEDKEVDPLSEEYVDEEFQKYLDDKVLAKMTVESKNEDGFDVYKINFVADAELIDHLGKKLEAENSKSKGNTLNVLGADTEKLSDTVKSLQWHINIDKKDYYMRKIVVNSDLEVDSLSQDSLYLGNSSSLPKSSKAKLAFAAKFSDFGKEFDVKTPSGSITMEEYLNLASEIIQKAYSSMFESTATSSNDTKKLSDMVLIKSALTAYKRDNGKYPKSLTDLSKYVVEMPKEPNGADYYYSVSANQASYEICSILDNPQRFKLESCSNSLYNAAIKSP